jgi:serine protease Do
MLRSRTTRLVLLLSAVAMIFVVSGAVDVRFRLQDNTADALDLFGSDEPEDAERPFWRDGTSNEPVPPPGGGPPTFADLTESVSPAVVNIQTSRVVGSGLSRGPRSPLEEFFGVPELFQNEPREVPSLGTGFLISDDGYIVTNNHVIEGVDTIEVHFLDGEVREAELVGRDPKTDIALIKVEGEGLPYLPLGDSDRIRPGDWVVAVGNPFGLEHTVTAGIVSAKHREINDPRSDARRFDDFIQTDAAINPGNSGGPLLNLAGEVVGINTAIRARANTIGFAVPVNQAKAVLPQLRVSGRVSRGKIGVLIQPVTEETAELLGLDEAQGALVSQVEPGGPADEAGIRPGDVIISFNGKLIEEMDELPKLVAAQSAGGKAKVDLVRKGKERSVSLVLGELEKDVVPAVAEAEPEPETGAYGLQVQDLTQDLATRLELEDTNGVLIAGIEADSPAAEAGLRRGDVIVEANQQPVEDVVDFREALEASDKGALLLVRRGGTQVFIALQK